MTSFAPDAALKACQPAALRPRRDNAPRKADDVARELAGSVSVSDRRRLQLVQLSIADSLVALCDKHSISYVLLGGSALGARRHAGFIPWDDDMDFGILRANFERFLDVAREEFPDQLHLQYWLDDPHMGVPFAKVRLHGTRLVEDGSRDVGGNKGIAIDIFPFDNVPAGIGRYWWLLRLKILKRLLRHQSGYTIRKLSPSALMLDLPLRMAARLLPVRWTKAALHELMTRYADRPSEQVLAVGGAYDFDKDMLSRQWLEDRQAMKFEGRDFFCPAATDEYLAHMYGDFMTLPPVEDRIGRHALLELRFDEDSTERAEWVA